jgi:LmbE family N-acetylglucosaminyl deacetylase
MLILAHPDDESLGNGGIIAKYAAEGVKTYLVTATRGESGWFGPEDENPGPEALGRIREGELRDAAEILGLQEVNFLDYRDGELADADSDEVVEKIVTHIRRIRPQVVVTFDQNGLYGHPDHIAICQLTTAAVAAAADPDYPGADGQPPHHVSKLYYMAWTQSDVETYHAAFGELAMQINGHRRSSVAWPEWSITTRIDATAHGRVEAIARHCSQLPATRAAVEEKHSARQARDYRAFSRVPVARTWRTTLFGAAPVDSS